jgi:hypothetical protein
MLLEGPSQAACKLQHHEILSAELRLNLTNSEAIFGPALYLSIVKHNKTLVESLRRWSFVSASICVLFIHLSTG